VKYEKAVTKLGGDMGLTKEHEVLIKVCTRVWIREKVCRLGKVTSMEIGENDRWSHGSGDRQMDGWSHGHGLLPSRP